MTNDPSPVPPPEPLVEVPAPELAELVAIALGLTKGAIRKANIAREANSAVAERLIEYFKANGMMVMRPLPRRAWSSNLRAGQNDALSGG